MHPADEFVAIAALINDGAIGTVALRFGTSERHGRQRLRLGNRAPELLDALRAGDIGLEAVTAFTLGTDHAAQLAVWAQFKEHSYISPHRIRHLLTESTNLNQIARNLNCGGTVPLRSLEDSLGGFGIVRSSTPGRTKIRRGWPRGVRGRGRPGLGR